MELLSWWAADVILTALIVSVTIALLGAAAFSWATRRRPLFGRMVAILLAFALLGFVVGQLMGESRDSAVGTVVPSVLTLIGGAAAYVVGAKGLRAQLTVASTLLCFTLSLLIGAIYGVRLRVDFLAAIEEPNRLRLRDLALENNKRAVEIQRLEFYADVLKFQRDLANEEGVDLSRFESSYEKAREKPKQVELVPASPAVPSETKK